MNATLEFGDGPLGAGREFSRERQNPRAGRPRGMRGEVRLANGAGQSLLTDRPSSKQEHADDGMNAFHEELTEKTRSKDTKRQSHRNASGRTMRKRVEDRQAVNTLWILRRPIESNRSAPIVRHYR